MRRSRRHAWWGLVLAAVCALGIGCANGSDQPGLEPRGATTAVATVSAQPTLIATAVAVDTPVPSGLRVSRSGWKTDFGKHTVLLGEISSGGPPRDGIPPIDRPRFVDPGRASG